MLCSDLYLLSFHNSEVMEIIQKLLRNYSNFTLDKTRASSNQSSPALVLGFCSFSPYVASILQTRCHLCFFCSRQIGKKYSRKNGYVYHKFFSVIIMLLSLKCKKMYSGHFLRGLFNYFSLHRPIGPFTKRKLYPEKKDTTFVYVKFYGLSTHTISVEVLIYSLYDMCIKTGVKLCHFLMFLTSCPGAKKVKSCVTCSCVATAIPSPHLLHKSSLYLFLLQKNQIGL